MKYSVSIMAHPSRKKYVSYLKGKLGDIPVAYDKGGGLWETCKKAWSFYNQSADYHLVVQDDAIICKNFYNRLEKHLKKQKGNALSLYVGRRREFKNMSMDKIIMISEPEGGFLTSGLSWGVAVCLPTYLIKEMIAFGDRRKSIKQDDTKISKFLKKKRIKTFYTVPTLVDHRAEIKSLCYNNINLARKSIKFVGEC